MTDLIERAPIASDHFTLIENVDAYGGTVHLRGISYAVVHLLQPMNEWAQEHYSVERDKQNLLAMLEEAFQRGRDSKLKEIQDLLGIRR